MLDKEKVEFELSIYLIFPLFSSIAPITPVSLSLIIFFWTIVFFCKSVYWFVSIKKDFLIEKHFLLLQIVLSKSSVSFNILLSLKRIFFKGFYCNSMNFKNCSLFFLYLVYCFAFTLQSFDLFLPVANLRLYFCGFNYYLNFPFGFLILFYIVESQFL